LEAAVVLLALAAFSGGGGDRAATFGVVPAFEDAAWAVARKSVLDLGLLCSLSFGFGCLEDFLFVAVDEVLVFGDFGACDLVHANGPVAEVGEEFVLEVVEGGSDGAAFRLFVWIVLVLFGHVGEECRELGVVSAFVVVRFCEPLGVVSFAALLDEGFFNAGEFLDRDLWENAKVEEVGYGELFAIDFVGGDWEEARLDEEGCVPEGVFVRVVRWEYT
jgi:hypothetical protein